MKIKSQFCVSVVMAACAVGAQASTLTETSPLNGALPSTISSVGGIVIDLTGSNGNRLLTQAAASTLFIGNPPASAYPLLVGTQTGFTPSILSALGGGIVAAAVRVSLYDGDNQTGDFDFHRNSLLLNGISFGDFSNVATNQTTSTGGFISASTGFGDDTFDTGWFTLTNASTLASFYSTLSGGSVQFRLADLTAGDQFYDFTQGVDSSIVNVGTPPVIAPPVNAVPEPESYALLLAGLGGLFGLRQRQHRQRPTPKA